MSDGMNQILNAHRRRYARQLKAKKIILKRMENQISNDTLECQWPMFENVTHDQFAIAAGFSINFHVIYAESKILEYLAS